MSKNVIAGSLAPQNWHRQARKLPPEKRFDFVYGKTVDVAKRFGFKPMGIDFGLGSLPSQDDNYLDELKARLKEDNIVACVGFGGIALSNDADVRRDSIANARRNLDKVARLGVQRSNFGCGFNGRVKHEGRIKFCVDMLKELGPHAKGLGIRITQENYDYWKADDLARICEAVGMKEWVGVHSDTGNWLIMDEDPVTATRKVLPYTLHAHVRDYVVENDTYNGVALGAGLVDFDKVLPLLAQAPVDEIVFSMEVDTDDRDEDQEAEKSYEYLKSWLQKNGYM